ncbi:unnamed protein product [Strongylus vulgaris]|uniref:Uncharacterized protein n=1 Tax=Strongylus vulgaris TaxID=40348 RepID=A0A3P7J2W7_STRVU|nr:unnamed protein product [Strongylus vulgaris]
MKRCFLTATAAILVLLYNDDVVRYLHDIEDTLLPLDAIDYDFLHDLEETEYGLILKGTNPKYLNCSEWKSSANQTFAKGWSKSVISLKSDSVAKFPNFEGRTYQNCGMTYGKILLQEERCRAELLQGFINEIKMLLRFRNDSRVINMISYCIPQNLKQLEYVNIVTEKGTPLDIVLVQQQPKIVDLDEAYFIGKEDKQFGEYLSKVQRKLASELLINETISGRDG